jgi:hypothetical protein
MAAKSISGYGMKLCNGPIIWYSKRQSTTAQSTAEAEYISANMCARALVWLSQLLSCLGFPPTGPTTIYENNQSCIAIAKHPQINEKNCSYSSQVSLSFFSKCFLLLLNLANYGGAN